MVELLENLSPMMKENFSLSSWLNDVSLSYAERTGRLTDAFSQGYADMKVIPHNCGMVACACGYAGLDDWFRSQGFETNKDGNIQFDGYKCWDAVEQFFDLDWTQADYLFSDEHYEDATDPLLVAERIIQFLNNGEMVRIDDDD